MFLEVLDSLYLQAKTVEDRVRGEAVSPFELIEPGEAEEGWQDMERYVRRRREELEAER